MADIQSNINLDIDASGALATLKTLQRQISAFQQTMAKTGAMSNARLGDMQQNLVNSINSTGQFTASIQKVRTTTESFTNALEKNKLSMGQYFRYSMGATKTFGKGFKTEFDTIEKVARERVKTLQTQYIKLGRDGQGAMQAIAVRPQVLDMKDLGTQTAIAAQKAQLFNQLMSQGSTNLLNFGKNTQWAGRQLMVGFTIPLGIMGAAAAKEFKAIEEQVIRLERVYGDFTTTMADTQEMTQSIKGLADEFTKYGVAVSKTIGLAADAAAMGSVGADLVAQVAEANRLAVLGGVQQEQALETTISLTSAFGVAREELAKKTDFLNAVENQTITSIEDLTTAIPKAGPVVQQLGGNVEDLTFFLTAMREGGINASESANALKSGLASLINPTAEASEMLGGFGINLQGIVEANKGNVKGIVIDFAKALDTLDPLNRAQAIEQLFGKFQFSRLSTLFQNVIKEGGQASRVLELTQSSAAELAALSERELGKVEASPLFQFEGAIERFKAALAPVGEEFMKAVTPLINLGTQILEGFNNMEGGVKQFSVIAIGAIGAIGPVLLMTIGLLMNGFANMVKGVLFVRNGFKGMGDQGNILTNQLNYMNSEQLESAAVSASLNQVHNTLIQTFTAEAGAVRNLAAAYGSAIAAQGAFAGPITTRGGGMKKPKGFAQGGIFRGPGTGTSDSIAAMVSDGEAIIPAKSVARFPEMVNSLISGNVPGFARGKGSGSAGRVGKSGMAISRPYIENVSNTSGILGFTDILGTDLADISSIYVKQIVEAAGISVPKITKEIMEWETANTEAINKATAAVDAGAEPAQAYKKLIEKFNRDMEKAGGPVSKFSATAQKMMPELSKDLKEAQTYAKKMKLDVRNASDAAKLAKALPGNTVAQGMVTPGNYQAMSRARSAGAALFGGGDVDKYGIPRFMVGKDAKPASRSYKLGSSQEHFSETPEHAANLARLRGEQVVAEKKVTRSAKKKAVAAEAEARQAELKAKSQMRSDAARRGWETRRARAEQQIAQQAEIEARQKGGLRGKLGRVSMGGVGMAGMVAGGALSAMSMMGGPAGDIAGQIGGPLMAVSGIASVLGMIPGPAGLVVAALGGVAAGMLFLNAESQKAKEAAREQANALAVTTKNMDAFAEAAGTVNPLRAMTTQRTEARVTGSQEQTFGESYLQQESGAAMLSGIKKAVDSQGMAEASKKMAAQLSTAVASGILSADQADSVAMALGDELRSDTFAINIMGNMDKLIGPNGEDLAKDPLKVSVEIAKTSQAQAVRSLQNAILPAAQAELGQGQLQDFSRTVSVKAQQEKIRNNSVDIISDFNSMQQQNQMLLAAQDLQNEQVVQQLMAEGKIAEAKEKQLQYDQQRKVLTDQIAASTRSFTDQLKGLDAESRNILVRESAEQAKGAYKGTEMESEANKVVDTLAGGRASAEAKLTLNAELASGTLTPDQLETVFNIFDQGTLEGGRAVNLLAKINTEMGSEVTSDIANLLPLFGDNEVAAANFLATFDVNNPEKFKESVDLFQQLQMGNPELDLSIYFDGSDAAIERMNLLMSATEKLRAMAAEGPITMQSVISQIFQSDPSAAAALMANNEYFASLPEEQKTAYIQYFITARDDVKASEVAKYLSDNKVSLKGRSADSAERAVSNAANAVAANKAKGFTQQYGSFMNLGSTRTSGGSGGGTSTPSGGGGGGGASQEPEKPPTSFLDSIVKDMKQFTTATQSLTENFTDSMNAIRSSSASAFGGLSQQLRRVGVGEDVIALMTGMSKEEWDQYKGQFFNFDAAGNITGFKADLTSISNKLRTITLGKFVDEQQKSLVNLNAQSKALTKLVGLGMTYADAYSLVEDAAVAAAIASATSADQIREIIALATQAQKALTLAEASESVAGTNAATDATLAGLNALIQYNSALSDAQVSAILASDELQTMLANFDTLSIDQLKVLNEALQDAANKEALEIQIKMQTAEGMQDLFNEGFGKAMEQFSAREQEIKIKFTALKDPFADVIKSFSQQIEDMKEAPGGLDDLEADLQRIGEQEIDINKKYDERFKALDSIAKVNERIAAQQRTQLSLSEALSMGDIASAARVAQEMRAADAAQALVDQREALQKSQELELENLMGNMGMTRAQLEAQIRDIKQQIFEIEEKQLEPAQYQIDLLTRQEELELSSLTILGQTRDEWEAVKNQVELARTSSDSYADDIERADGLVQQLINKWNEVPSQVTTIHTIIEDRITAIQNTPPPAPAPAPAPVASTAPAPAYNPANDPAWVNSMAIRTIRGEFGNGQARRNALGANYDVIQNRVNQHYAGARLFAKGGYVASYMANGGMTKPMFAPKGTDTVPAMLTPGEFVVKKWAVDKFGVGNLNAINQGNFGSGSVYNYNMSVNVRSDANPDEIARTVMTQIKRVDAQRIRGNRF